MQCKWCTFWTARIHVNNNIKKLNKYIFATFILNNFVKKGLYFFWQLVQWKCRPSRGNVK